MKKIKVLNLYAGIGGNRKLWPNQDIEVTAIEIKQKSMWYEPLIKPQISGRHYFWANFIITNKKDLPIEIGTMNKSSKNKRIYKSQTERNSVNGNLGLHIYNCAFKIKQETL